MRAFGKEGQLLLGQTPRPVILSGIRSTLFIQILASYNATKPLSSLCFYVQITQVMRFPSPPASDTVLTA